MESREMVLNNLFTGQQWRNRHREQTYGHGDRRRKGEIFGNSNVETCITICKIDSQGKFAVWLRQQQGLCINLEGWDGAGDGRGYIYICIYLWLISCWSLTTTKFCKAIILQLKKNKLKENINGKKLSGTFFSYFFLIADCSYFDAPPNPHS